MNLHMIRAVRLVNAQQKGLPVADFIAALDDVDCSDAFDELMRRRGRKTWLNGLGGYLSGLSFAERTALYEAGSAFSPLLEASLMADLAALSYAEQMDLLLSGSALGKLVAPSLFGDPDSMAIIAGSPELMVSIISSQSSLDALFANPGAAAVFMASTALAAASVPKMTSNTTPSGVASASSIHSTGTQPYLMFDKTSAHFGVSAASPANQWVQYKFEQEVFIHTAALTNWNTAYSPKDCRIEYSNDGVSFQTATSTTFASGLAGQSVSFAASGFYQYWRLFMVNTYGQPAIMSELNFTGFAKP